jgi:LysR family transcriptional regulator, benzoate and cis,cis-muconate-responsive activator of ben and cat genes
MELRHLRYFIAVAEEENVTRAAAVLHVSQPPLSRQIHDLEDELGVPLFERGAKSLRLTEAGRLFLTEARAVLERAEQAAAAVKSLGSGLTGELNVGYAPSLAVDILPRALRNLQLAAPKIRVHLHDLSSGEMLEGLRKNQLDIALTIEQPSATLRGLHTQKLHAYKVCVALNPAHPLARRKTIRLADIAHERLIGYSQQEYPEFLEGLKRLPWPKQKMPTLAEEHDSVTSLIAAVEAGRGITIAPDSLSCLSGPRLKLLPIHPVPPPFHVVAMWRTLNPKSKRFLEAAAFAP